MPIESRNTLHWALGKNSALSKFIARSESRRPDKLLLIQSFERVRIPEYEGQSNRQSGPITIILVTNPAWLRTLGPSHPYRYESQSQMRVPPPNHSNADAEPALHVSSPRQLGA